MVPEEVMANWMDIGTPAASWALVMEPDSFHCFRSGFRSGALNQI